MGYIQYPDLEEVLKIDIRTQMACIHWQASEAGETLSGLNNGNRIYYKYSTLQLGISMNIEPKVRVFPEAEGRGKYSLPRVQYYGYSTRKG